MNWYLKILILWEKIKLQRQKKIRNKLKNELRRLQLGEIEIDRLNKAGE